VRTILSIGVLTIAGLLMGSPAQASVAAAPGAGHETPAQGVVAQTTAADGTTHVSIYEPAPGVSDQQLYHKLKVRGIAGLRQPAKTGAVGPLDANTCTLGTATTAYCPQAHWARNGYAHPQVYIVDHTGPAWPVSAAVPVWNQAHGVDSLYRPGTCPGIPGTHCVDVRSANEGDNGFVGTTNVSFDAGRNFIDGGVNVVMNDFYTISAARHRKSICHELGHVIGLGHNSSTASCMVSGDFDAQLPSADDFAMAAEIYSSF
jgi:hypothetical protein